MSHPIEDAFAAACERYDMYGVDVEAALEALGCVSLSLPCWQGDDGAGFETLDDPSARSGIAVSPAFPGRARTIDELRADLQAALALIPGRHRLNLHAIYGDFGGKPVARNEILPEHYQSWVDWAAASHLGLDFNSTCFSHPMADSGFTLSSPQDQVRRFWIEHVRRCREIGAWMGRELGTPSLHNLSIPDGSKESPVTRFQHRATLRDSLDEIFATEHPAEHLKDSIESKRYGLGSESFVVGSHEFYVSWAAGKQVMPCLDMGHMHPAESVADRISTLLQFHDRLALHLSRDVHWNSDHVVTQNDELIDAMQEIVRAGALARIHFALDFFDNTINRVGAWVIGARATLKALLFALLEPLELLGELEEAGDYFARLATIEEVKLLPFGAVWEYYCHSLDVPDGFQWLTTIRAYEDRVLRKRR
ncbi:MAG: L-rhamnose isomerase [Candidatus Lernaella stagnicola]|nr:L-rhamnose isomerase [Candidatus Lernaella stagnicola]